MPRQPETFEDSLTRKEQKAREAAEALRDHEAEARRVDANTKRLRALRLARDQRAAEAAAEAKPAPRGRKGRRVAIPLARLNASNDQ